jgi:hypothetical protein
MVQIVPDGSRRTVLEEDTDKPAPGTGDKTYLASEWDMDSYRVGKPRPVEVQVELRQDILIRNRALWLQCW